MSHLDSKQREPLRMIITGSAGSGKSWLLKLLQQHLPSKNQRFTATTGSAAILIDGTTIHHLLRLPTKKRSKKPLSGDALIQFQKGFNLTAPPCNTYIFIDEMSMIGKDCFYWIDQRARQATAQASLTFGGLSIILVGDFGQLPPVLDSSLFAEIPFSKRNDFN